VVPSFYIHLPSQPHKQKIFVLTHVQLLPKSDETETLLLLCSNILLHLVAVRIEIHDSYKPGLIIDHWLPGQLASQL